MVTQLPTGSSYAEINPFRPDLPDSIRQLSPELYEFLREFVLTSRAEHNRQQAGDTTFPWQVMLGIDSKPTYNLGSLGRFYHIQHGILEARYVRFGRMDASLSPGGPVGLYAQDGYDWGVTNIKAYSKGTLGLLAPYVVPVADTYGWVITRGFNLQSLQLNVAVRPTLTQQWVWKIGDGLDLDDAAAAFVGQIVDSTQLTAANGGWQVAPAALAINVTPTSDLHAILSQIDVLNGKVAGIGINAIKTQIDALNQSLAQFKDLVSTSQFSVSRQLRKITDTQNSATATDSLNVMANYLVQAKTASDNAVGASRQVSVDLAATNELTRQAGVYNLQAGYYAESATIQSNTALLIRGDTRILATAAQTYSASAGDSAAQAAASLDLVASYGAGGANDVFNSDMSLGTTGFNFIATHPSHFVVNYNGPDAYRPGTENMIGLYQNDSAAEGSDIVTDWMPVTPGELIEVSAWMAAERCDPFLKIQWGDLAGIYQSDGPTATPPTGTSLPQPYTGTIDGYMRLSVRDTVPNDIYSVRCDFVKPATNGGSADSWMYFTRPMKTVVRTSESQPRPYYANRSEARYRNTQAVRATADAALATSITSLTATVGTNSASITTLQGAQVTTDGKTHAWFEIDAVAGGRAQLVIHADEGGGGVDIGGDLRVSGAALINGTLTAAKIVDLSLTAAKMDYGSVGECSIFYNNNGFSFNSDTTWQAIATLTITSTQGQPIMGQAACVITDTSGSSTRTYARVTRDDGTVIWGGSSLIVASRDEGEGLPVLFFDSLDAGDSATYTLEMKKYPGSSDYVNVTGRAFIVRELVRDHVQHITLADSTGQGPGMGSGGGGNINGLGHGLSYYY